MMLQHQQEAMPLLVSLKKSHSFSPAASVVATFRSFIHLFKQTRTSADLPSLLDVNPPHNELQLQLKAFENRWDPKIASLSHRSSFCMNGKWMQKVFFVFVFLHYSLLSSVHWQSGKQTHPLLLTLPPVHAGTCLMSSLCCLIGIWTCCLQVLHVQPMSDFTFLFLFNL